MRVLHGTTDAANQAYYSVLGLRDLGIDARNARFTDSPLFQPADYELSIDRTKRVLLPYYGAKIARFAQSAISEFDMFHFHCGRSLLPKNWDLSWLDKKGKPYYFEYHGSEIRNGKPWQANPYSGHLSLYQENPALVARAQAQLANARGAIVHDAEIGMYVPEGAPTFYIPLRMNVGQFEPSFPDESGTRRPLIVHAPSKRGVKGSEYVERALQRLSEVYDFDFALVENVTQVEAFEIYKRADIIIDQLFIGSYGVFALEAMALGKPVITYLRPDLLDSFPESLPILSANIDNLGDVVADLLERPGERARIGRRGREYVETYHDYRKVASLLADLYTSGKGCRCPQEAYRSVARL